MISLPHGSIRITIQTLWYDTYHDTCTWKNPWRKNKWTVPPILMQFNNTSPLWRHVSFQNNYIKSINLLFLDTSLNTYKTFGMSFYHKDTTMYHKDTTRNHKDTTRNFCLFTTRIPQGYQEELWGISGLPNDTSWYHKDFLEYSAMSI
jgi:hypothetical protein